jgi:hypothetical protein
LHAAIPQVISQTPATGEVMIADLADLQGQSFSKSTVIMAKSLGGMEDIPPGICGQ